MVTKTAIFEHDEFLIVAMVEFVLDTYGEDIDGNRGETGFVFNEFKFLQIVKCGRDITNKIINNDKIYDQLTTMAIDKASEKL